RSPRAARSARARRYHIASRPGRAASLLRHHGEHGGIDRDATVRRGHARDIAQAIARLGVEHLDLAPIYPAVFTLGLDQGACKNDGVHDWRSSRLNRFM